MDSAYWLVAYFGHYTEHTLVVEEDKEKEKKPEEV